MSYFSPGMQSIQHEYIQFQHVQNLIYTVYKVGLHLISIKSWNLESHICCIALV